MNYTYTGQADYYGDSHDSGDIHSKAVSKNRVKTSMISETNSALNSRSSMQKMEFQSDSYGGTP
jgi:hypothetical protein